MPVAGYRPYDARRAVSYERQRADQPEWSRERAIIAAAVATMPAGATVLDVPVGTGRFLPLYADRGLRATGVDVSSDMLAEARKKDLPVRLLTGDVTGDLLKLLGGFVDYSVCLRLINWLTPAEAERAIAQLLRVTRTAVWVGLWSADTAGVKAASAETQAEGEVEGWVAAAGWSVAARHVLALGPIRVNAIWELRRAAR